MPRPTHLQIACAEAAAMARAKNSPLSSMTYQIIMKRLIGVKEADRTIIISYQYDSSSVPENFHI